MYPSLSTRRRVLLSLLILGGRSTYSSIKSFLPIGYFGPKFYGMLKRLEKEGLVKRHNPSIRLLPAGIELLEQRYGQRLNLIRTLLGVRQGESLKDLKENWSLIILNFPTDQAYSRSRLVGRLVELGCGCLRDGAYISPYPILDVVAQWAEENRCLERVALATINNQQSTINNFLNGWDLSAFSRRYFSLLDRLNISKGISLSSKRGRTFARIKSDFLDLLISDPLLPKPFLPADYPLARVIGEITNLDKNISTDGIKIDNLPGKKIYQKHDENRSQTVGKVVKTETEGNKKP